MSSDIGQSAAPHAPETSTSGSQTAAPTKGKPDPRRLQAEALVRSVAGLYGSGSGSGRARLAGLRRAAGESFGTARDLGWLYGVFARYGVREEDEEAYLLAISLLAFDRRALETGGRAPHTPAEKGIGTTLHRLWLETKGTADTDRDRPDSPIARRLRILLDADYDPRSGTGDLPFRLRQVIRLSLSKEIGPDWPQLILDLCDWNRADKRVQKRWARDFFAPQTTAEGDATASGSSRS